MDGNAPQGIKNLHGLPFVFPGVSGVGCFFSTIQAGNMAVTPGMSEAGARDAARNRRSLLRGLGLSDWVELRQVHKDGLIADPAPTPAEEASSLEGDGSCTRRKGLVLAVKTADCQPVLLTDLRGRAVAALHVGWRGNAINFPASGVARFCEACGIAPEETLAVRGPSLGPGEAEFVNFSREWGPEFRLWYDERARKMDLWSLTRHQLTQAGLRPEHIYSLDLCTKSLPELFFSYRLGHEGRQVSLIWLRQ